MFGVIICGLGLANQHSLVFYIIPAGLISLYWCWPPSESSSGESSRESNSRESSRESSSSQSRESNSESSSVLKTEKEKEKKESTTVMETMIEDDEEWILLDRVIEKPWTFGYFVSICFVTLIISSLSLYMIYLPFATGKKGSWGVLFVKIFVQVFVKVSFRLFAWSFCFSVSSRETHIL